MGKPHAIVFPYPYQGNMTPMVNLTLKLASSAGFTITFVQTQYIHHTISRAHQVSDPDHFDPFDQARKRNPGLDIRYTTIYDGFPLEFDRNAGYDEYWETMFRDFPGRVKRVIQETVQQGSDDDVFFLLADTYHWWASTIASKYKLVHVALWTEPAMVFALNYHLDLLREHGHFPWKGNGEDIINYIPGAPTLSTRDLMTYVQEPDSIATLIQVVIKGFEQVKQADFVVCNTVLDLEPQTMSCLNQKLPAYAIGPTSLYPESTQLTAMPKSLRFETDCSEWLESKPCGSVLYVSFGSVAQTSRKEIAELAYGLADSGVNFIWVLRTDILIEEEEEEGGGILPVGFEESIKDRGLIVPWCNQNTVLSSPACGGFLTHCGWNSTMESLWCGVPMICYPFLVDQPTVRKLIVDYWNVGIDLCDGEELKRDQVVGKIHLLMKADDHNVKGMEMRKEIKKLSKLVRDSLAGDDGCTQRSFTQFVKDLKVKLYG